MLVEFGASAESQPSVAIEIETESAQPIGGWKKRTFDVFGSLSALLLLSPIFLWAALMVKLTTPGPVFFKHERIGFRGRAFPCYKFRTMVVDADERLRRVLVGDPVARIEWAECRKLKRDPRITWIGQMLRLSSIDELPQLINVIRGEMSLVGPRPIVQEEIVQYRDRFEEYQQTRPGITGSWQVSGRNDVSYEERTTIDQAYVRRWTFLGDILIILKTIPAVLFAKGCY